MAFIRYCLFTAVLALCIVNTKAQSIYYPQQSSQLLKSTVEDIAMLMQKANPTGQFISQAYTILPATGIIFVYDSTISVDLGCKVESDGMTFIKFSAALDNGLCFGVYRYLNNRGFKFFQPGSIWEVIPILSNVFSKMDTVYSESFKYKSWFISGSHRKWVMDNNSNYGWDNYHGLNGHNWALYQRRNGMNGVYGFQGHRGDIMNGAYLAALQNNPCYVANNNNSRLASNQSVPDVNSDAAMQLWSNTIEQKYTQTKNILYSNPTLYVNAYRNSSFNHVGIEVPDGARWGNTKSDIGCGVSGYTKESDQQFVLSNYTAQKINAKYPNLRFQLYAYSTHADVPSQNIAINDKIDIQLIPAVYQLLSSTNGLRNRWYNRSKNISEYHYLNLSGWSGETPDFHLDDLKATVAIAKEKKSQGIVWESSPAKFGSLPYLLAINNSLNKDISIDSSLSEFCNSMFSAAGNTINNLMHLWADEKFSSSRIGNINKLPIYLQLIAKAEEQIKNEPSIVYERLRELKAYLHYMILYYEWLKDTRPNNLKTDITGDLCIYLAKTNKIQIVNSYYLIHVFASRYPTTSNFYLQYNNINGLAYQNGNLPLITANEIDNNFKNDVLRYSNQIEGYKFETTSFIKNQFEPHSLIPLKKISVQLRHTNGMDFYSKFKYHVNAPSAGNFVIDYKPIFNMPDKGYINFTIESADKSLQIIEDISLDETAKSGQIIVNLPTAGNYMFTITTKYKSVVDLEITPNKNFFYQNESMIGNVLELYQNESKDITGYTQIPKEIARLYFKVNYLASSGAISINKINSGFEIKDLTGNKLTARFVTPTDSTLCFIDIPNETKGKFISITRKGNNSLTFSNISNFVWFAQPKPLPCSKANFTIAIVNNNGQCITRLTADVKSDNLQWEIIDMGNTYYFTNQKFVDLPIYNSPNAQVTLTNGDNCSVTKRLRDDQQYLRAKEACAVGASVPINNTNANPVVYPNPSNGVFNFSVNGEKQTVSDLIITNVQGVRVANYSNVNQLNISNQSAGLYWYRLTIDGKEFKGKLLKL